MVEGEVCDGRFAVKVESEDLKVKIGGKVDGWDGRLKGKVGGKSWKERRRFW